MIFILLIVLIVMINLFVWAHTFWYKRNWNKHFHVKLSFSEEQAGEGDQLFLYETAINNKKMQLPILCLKFQTSRYLKFMDVEGGSVSDNFYRNDVMSVDGFEKVRRKLRFTCKKRGLYEINQVELVSYDLFCNQTFAYKVDVNATLCVYPSLIDIKKLLPVFRNQNGGMPTNVPLFEDPFAFSGVREYTPQDSMRRIHWNASARTGQWQVKTTEYMASTKVVIILNLESPGVFTDTDLMEESIRLAYSFVHYLGNQGVTTRLVISGNEKIRLEGVGRNHISAVRRALATIAYDKVNVNGETLIHRETELISPEEHVIFISAAGKKPLQEVVTAFLHKNDSFTWVAPMITSNGEDSEFKELLPSIEKCLVKWGGM